MNIYIPIRHISIYISGGGCLRTSEQILKYSDAQVPYWPSHICICRFNQSLIM